MMQHMSSEEHLPSGLGISQVPQVRAEGNPLSFGTNLSPNDQLQNFSWAQGLGDDLFDSDLEFNRRTLTQENFDAMTRNRGMLNGAGEFESFDANFSGDHDTMNQVFPVFDMKQEHSPFPCPMVAPPLSSNDSTVPSVMSEHSMHAFPSSHAMQTHANMSASGSDWTGSRTSSLASAQHGSMGAPMLPPQPPPQTTSQWEPGKSVPVDVDAMKDQFQQAAAQANQVRASMDQSQAYEQPLAYPTDEAYARRGSTASLLAQSMGGIGLHTPQPNQGDGVFKSPAPPTSLAARRQRPKPANLGIASLRSQSYGGSGQPGSPGHQHSTVPGQSIRRVMSTNVLNGGVVQGRVMKSVPGSAQRSPLNWTFNDALNSPHLVRAVSQGNLAPPTPMSPSHPSQAQQLSGWQIGPGDLVRQPSISETQEQSHGGLPYQCSGSVPAHVSPPHTPMWYQQHYVPQRVGNNVIMENTPPQSAPASQSCFPSNVFGALPPQQAQNAHMVSMVNCQQQQYLNLAIPDQQYQVHNVTFAPNQHANVVSSGPPPGMPLTFATGVPVVRDDGNIQMSFPQQMQIMQPHQQTNSPPQMPYAFVNSNGGSPGTLSTSHPLKLATQPPNDFVVHEYTPPDSIKRSVTPRKAVDSGPKNYTFANAGPVDYEEKKAKRADAKESSSSPASSIGTASTS
jgi:hypothetical protein